MIAGIDEAGRGAIIGPLVVAGALFNEQDEHQLRKIGVRDSKELAPKKRERLAKQIEGIAQQVIVIKVSPCRIDNSRRTGTNLNHLEAEKFAEILNYLTPATAFIDGPDVNLPKFTATLRSMLDNKSTKLVVEHKADTRYPTVGAASILAKVARDADIEKLKAQYGDIGPGYTSNEITMQWLRNWRANNKDWPDIVRKTWVTIETIDGEHKQRKLGQWFRKKKPC
ncbi:MAG: ribonuclease HII [Nanoarchaeota archaeon]|nr:ribonuclease HII [Nanoarchaeota archaeon]